MTETMISAVKKTATEAFKWSRGWAGRIEQLLIGRYLTELFLPISAGPLYLVRRTPEGPSRDTAIVTETTISTVKKAATGALRRWRARAEAVQHRLAGRYQVELHRALATVLFTDIVGSTNRAAEVGDRQWMGLLKAYYTIVRRELAVFHGREVNTAGDGFLATFDLPAGAIGCASAIRDRVRTLGLQIRAGLHTGECELMGTSIGGIAVHIGARVAAMAGPSEVLVSSTVKDLVLGSGIQFVDRGTHSLKGVPGEWRVFLAQWGL